MSCILNWSQVNISMKREIRIFAIMKMKGEYIDYWVEQANDDWTAVNT
jgi:hypothetical protein